MASLKKESKPSLKIKLSKRSSKSESETDDDEKNKSVKEKDKKRRQVAVSNPLAIVNCTACARQINPARDSVLRKHPDLSVLICKKCWSFYHSGEVTKDEDGLDEQCRWCGEGGKLLGCDYCNNVFCKSCILRNFGRSELSSILDESKDDSKWKCYVCNKEKLKPLIESCEELFQKVAEEKKSSKEKSNGVEKSAPTTLNGNELDFNVNPSNLLSTVKRLSLINNCFQDVLEGVQIGLKSEAEDDSSDSTHPDSQALLRKAKTLEKGLKSYFQSFFEILKPSLSTVINLKSKSSKSKWSKKKNRDISDISDDNSDSSSSKYSKQSSKESEKSSVESSKEKTSLFSKNDNGSNSLDQKKMCYDGEGALLKQSSVTKYSDDDDGGDDSDGECGITDKEEKSKDNSKKRKKGECSDQSDSAGSNREKKKHKTKTVDSPSVPMQSMGSSESDIFDEVGLNGDNISDISDASISLLENSNSEKISANKTMNGGISEDENSENKVAEMELLKELADELCKNADKDDDEDADDMDTDDLPDIIPQNFDSIKDSSEEEDSKVVSSHVDKDSNSNQKNKKTSILEQKKKAPKDSLDAEKVEVKDKEMKKEGKTTEKEPENSSPDKDENKKKTKDKSKHSRHHRPEKTKQTDVKAERKLERKVKEKFKEDYVDDVSSSDLIMSSSSGEEFDIEPIKSSRERKSKKARGKKSKDKNSDSDDDSDFDYKKSKKEMKEDIKTTKKTKQRAKERRKTKEMEGDSDSSDDGINKTHTKKEAASDDNDVSENKATNGSSAKKNGKSKTKGSDDSDFSLDKEIEKLTKEPEMKKKSAMAASVESSVDETSDDDEKVKKNAKKSDQKEENGKKSKKKTQGDDESATSSSDDGKGDRDQSDEDSDELDKSQALPIPNMVLGENQDENEKAKNELLEDLKDEESSTVDEDSDEDLLKKKVAKSKVSKVKDEAEKDCSDSDFEPVKKKRFRSTLLDAKLSESDSDDVKAKKKSKKRKPGSDDDEFNPDDESDSEDTGKKKKKKKGKQSASSEEDTDTDEDKKKKRRRIKRPKNSSDEEGEDDDEKESPTKGGRKKIRKVMSDKKVTDETKAAAKAEEERRKRVAELQKKFNIVTIEDESSPTKCPITTKLVLESDKEGYPLVEVVRYLIKKLKPHQVEAVQFMWSCCIESLKRLKKEEGSGCILAHCMGLGKTLSVVSFVHTVLSSDHTNLRTCMIVSPLNTVLNWRNECTMWLREKDRMNVYELSSVKDNHSRSRYVREWQEEGGVLIIGYEMYRNLTNTARVRNKKIRKTFEETLVDPGPDLVVCDEGHVLKNEQSAISQAMNRVKTRRRIVLTGTPLQNNLVEYHCMVSFVKPKLLGTKKEFLNRFVNPITNGQCSDSTPHDVRVMKRRAHVLHEMLAGCVQRKDYSALTKFLPPKLEYVISVRLAPVQMKLYEKYLETSGQGLGGPIITKGGRLFQDYQALSKIWTHPWVLKLSEIRQEAKMKYDDEDEDEEELSEDDSFIDDSSSESSMSTDSKSEDSMLAKGDSDSASDAGPRTRRTRGKAKLDAKKKKSKEEQPSTSKGIKEDKNEVVHSWKTRSRGGGADGDNGELLPGLDESGPPGPISSEWWAEYLTEEDKHKQELSGKLTLLFDILQRCEEIGDKVLVFSQSLLSLDIIEDFLDTIDKKWQEEAENKTEEEKVMAYGKSWTKGADYFRMDGSTSVSLRQSWAEHFNDPENYRARLFIISTKAGGLGINLVGANRAIIFDASWNPSHDIQSIFRVYRFGQVKPVYIYRFLAQGTMEEKIYERQVTKQSLSQRVVDEHQIERHFTASDLQELYAFRPERLDDPNYVEKTPALPKDTLLAELLKNQRKWIVTYHEHDSLLENKVDECLTEEERKSAWEEYESDKNRQPVNRAPMMNPMFNGMMHGAAYNPQMSSIQQRAFSAENVSQVVQLVRSKFPTLTGDMFQAQVQNIIMQQIVQYQQAQEQEIAARQRQEMERLRQIQSQIASSQQQYNQASGLAPWGNQPPKGSYSLLAQQAGRMANPTSSAMENLIRDQLSTGPKEKTPSKNPPPEVDLTKS